MDKKVILEKKVIIFDLDGTLIDSIGIWNDVDFEVIKEFTGICEDKNKLGLQRDYIISLANGNNPYIYYVNFLKEKYNLSVSLDEIINYRKEIARIYQMERIKPKPYAKELIELLSEQQYILALATTAPNSGLNIVAFKNPYTSQIPFDKFRVVITAENVNKFKPDPEIHNIIMQRLFVKPNDCLLIEDSFVGVQAGKNAGIFTISVKEENNDNLDEIYNLSNMSVDSLEDIYKVYKKNTKNRIKELKKVSSND